MPKLQLQLQPAVEQGVADHQLVIQKAGSEQHPVHSSCFAMGQGLSDLELHDSERRLEVRRPVEVLASEEL